MFQTDEIIDDRYIVRGICSEAGGMGSLLFVNHTSDPTGSVRVLKYCKPPYAVSCQLSLNGRRGKLWLELC